MNPLSENNMKQNGKVLGDLSLRFFSYAQLKGLTTIRTGQLLSPLGISGEQEADLFRRLSGSGLILRLTRGTYLIPPHILAGGEYSPGIGKILAALFKAKNGVFQVTGQAAFNYHGFDNQVPVRTHVYNSLISGERVIGSLSFCFIRTSINRIGSIETVRMKDGQCVPFSSRERALFDSVYDWKRFNSLPAGYEWIRKEIKSDKEMAGKLIDVASRYGNQATMRRIGCVLDKAGISGEALTTLLSKLNRSDSWVPLVPGTHTRGKVDRAWGTIVND